MPISAEELKQWERDKARLRRQDSTPRPTSKNPEAAWVARQRKAKAAYHAKRRKALKDANLFYYYRPEIFVVII